MIHLRTVDVARPQPHHFTGPQPATIGERQHRSCPQACRHGEDTLANMHVYGIASLLGHSRSVPSAKGGRPQFLLATLHLL